MDYPNIKSFFRVQFLVIPLVKRHTLASYNAALLLVPEGKVVGYPGLKMEMKSFLMRSLLSSRRCRFESWTDSSGFLTLSLIILFYCEWNKGTQPNLLHWRLALHAVMRAM